MRHARVDGPRWGHRRRWILRVSDPGPRVSIKNQGWKDSSQAILYPDGSYVPNPIAVAEIQGLYYAAKQSLALVLQATGESDRAAELLEQAAALKRPPARTMAAVMPV